VTKLIVTPINMSAPGSFGQRKRLLQAMADLEQARETKSVVQMVGAFESIEALVRGHLETDDGTTVTEALEMCSANEFDNLIQGLVASETVPNPTSAS
jgi:hypothetical protein